MRVSEKRAAAEAELRRRIAEGVYHMGEKLPSEPRLASELGIARETLRAVADKLIQEKLLVRVPREGTFVMSGTQKSGEKIYCLIPYENFLTDLSLECDYGLHEFLQGILEASLRYDAMTVLVPVTTDHSRLVVCPQLLQMIAPGSIVICNSLWYQPLFPLLQKLHCRIGFFFDCSRQSQLKQAVALKNCSRATINWKDSFVRLIDFLQEHGCRKTGVVGYDLFDARALHVRGYLEAAAKYGMKDLRCSYAGANGDIGQVRQWCCEHAADLDSLIIRIPEIRYSQESPAADNLNDFLGIPPHIRLVSLFPHRFMSRLAEPVDCIRIPMKKIGFELAGSLLLAKPLEKLYQITIEPLLHGSFPSAAVARQGPTFKENTK